MADQVQDKRVERSKAAVLAETYRQLTRSGLSGVSIDEIARNSGVAKTTIYRHWPSRSALLIDACSRMSGASPLSPLPNTGSLRGDLQVLLTAVAEQLREAAWPSVLPSIIDAAEREPEIAAMQSTLLGGNTASFSAVLERARERGELPVDRQNADVIAGLLGPLFYRRWFSREVLDERFTGVIIQLVVGDSGGSGSAAKGTKPSAARRSAKGPNHADVPEDHGS